MIKKNSDIATLGNKITKVDFGDNNIVKVITENDIEKNKISKAKKFLRNCKSTPKKIYLAILEYINLGHLF